MKSPAGLMPHVLRLWILFLFFFAVPPTFAEEPGWKTEVAEGNFSKARQSIDLLLLRGDLPARQALELRFGKERLNRIEIDFNRTEDDILEALRRYYPDVDAGQLDHWKKARSLEFLVIDGNTRYFRNAVPNLFRIDAEAKARKIAVDGTPKNGLAEYLRGHLAEIVDQSRKTDRTTGIEERNIRIDYSLTVPPGTIPEGEVLRCWLPFPRSDHRRQTGVKLLDHNLERPIIAPDESDHLTIYSEKTTEKDRPTVFRISVEFRTTAEFFDLEKMEVQPYDKSSELYKKFTAERDTHVVFTESIRRLSREIVGDETDPVKVYRKIFDFITSRYPWTSAIEYSTMPNIPEYVIENRRGDCGMVALLLVTLCRYNGIPAKWQSGFMLHPGNVNLHDWAEVYFEGIGWIPADPSFGRNRSFERSELNTFYATGIDSYRWIVNEDYSRPLYPAKIFPRSETVDFQRGEVEWRGGNLYFNQWRWSIDVDATKAPVY